MIRNGIDTESFCTGEIEVRRLQEFKGIEADSFVLGYLGRYMPEKGFPVLIRALELLKQWGELPTNLRVLGLGWGAFIREYQAEIGRKALSRYFVFAPFQADVRWVLRQLDLLVIPSLREAFPLVPVEGLVSGTPILASDCMGLREVLKDSPASVSRAGNAQELARAILEKYENPQKKEAEAYVEEARRRFDSRVTALELDKLFDQIVNNHRSLKAHELAE